jgi:hypothetical protein
MQVYPDWHAGLQTACAFTNEKGEAKSIVANSNPGVTTDKNDTSFALLISLK